MSAVVSITLPLSIYVVFHPEADDCRDLAGRLFDWFRLEEHAGDSCEAGLPIWFRSRLDGERLSPPLDWGGAERNAVIILVDDHMVADPRWRSALEVLLHESEGQLRLPVAVDDSFYRLGFLYGALNPIRIGDPRAPDEPQARERWQQQRAQLARRAVTEAIIRELRDHRREDGRPDNLQIFLSHAKADGTDIAEAIRDSLAGLSQMQAWYDANELPPGYGWDTPMKQAAEQNTAVLLSVVTDVYPTRHWCRQE
ncbi:MAG: toll/interleukin-1 receptor domain-containing protein, partial [Myxococcales bacterium]|nr:toll/interleukin-1 receptor domain-containing protein [Myxococcales bacterium]